MTPEEIVTDIVKEFEITSKDIEKIRAQKDQWPRWCFAPFVVWASFLIRNISILSDPKLVSKITSACTVVPWRYTRSVYKFDPDLYRELVSTPITGDIPEEVVLRLPEWSVFVEMPGERYVTGFFASLEYVPLTKKSELRFVFCLTDESLYPFCVSLSKGSIAKSVRASLDEYESHIGNASELASSYAEVFGEDFKLLDRAVSLILYLCSDEAEIRDRDVPDWEPSFPRPKILKGRERLFPADRNRTVNVGKEIGAILRKEITNAEPHLATGRTVRSHMRRGHWHGFWTGPRKENRDRQKFVLKWLPPIVVRGQRE